MLRLDKISDKDPILKVDSVKIQLYENNKMIG